MKKYSFSKTLSFSQNEIKNLKSRGNPNTPYAKTLALKVGEGFVVYGTTQEELGLPYQQAKKLGMKFCTKSNYRVGDKKGTLVFRVR